MSIECPRKRSRAAASWRGERDERIAAHQQPGAAVVAAGAARRRRHRPFGARSSHEPCRRQYRRDPAPSDGGGPRFRPRLRAAGERRGSAAVSGAPADAGAPGTGALKVSDDRLLGGRVRLRQPAEGYRVAIDPVFLAAAVPAEPHQLVLDLGCGVVALEMQRELVRLAGDNIILNGLETRLSVMIGDLLRPPPRLSPGAFDHVMANPPYNERGRSHPATDPARAEATIEGAADLAAWVRFAFAMVRPHGSVTFIHRADRIDALVAEIAGRGGEMVVFPLWPGEGRAASRILVRARKQLAAPARLAPGLVLHRPDGRLSEAAEGVLRQGRGLEL